MDHMLEEPPPEIPGFDPATDAICDSPNCDQPAWNAKGSDRRGAEYCAECFSALPYCYGEGCIDPLSVDFDEFCESVRNLRRDDYAGEFRGECWCGDTKSWPMSSSDRYRDFLRVRTEIRNENSEPVKEAI